MKALTSLLCILLSATMLSSCVKDVLDDVNDPNNFCNELAQVNTSPFVPVTKGEEIRISADEMDGAYYQWTGPGNFDSYAASPLVSSYADYSDRGWYYVRVSVTDCNDKYDSVYVDVKFPQGSPACSPANNTATFGGAMLLGDQSYYFVSFGSSPGGYGVTGNSTNGDIHFTLSPYWLTHEFEDGIYYTTSDALPDYPDLDKIYMSSVNQSIFWVAEPNRPVYIDHVGGKPRIRFCSIDFSGSWGSSLYHTTVSGQITKP
jgi:hypothetical protein